MLFGSKSMQFEAETPTAAWLAQVVKVFLKGH